MKIVHSRGYLYIELALLVIGVPALLSTLIPIRYMLPSLWVIALYCHIIYRLVVDESERIYWRWDRVNAANVKPMLLRFAALALLTAALVAWFKPTMFLSFVCERPLFWAFVMVAYPLLSVIPQEIIFRSFFFQRYRRVFPKTIAMILASGLLFGAAHLIFQNPVAPTLCAIGGILFAQTYAKTQSLALVVIEHALYGCMMFTVGLGTYFYHGSVYSHRQMEVSQRCEFIPQRIEAFRASLP